MTALEQCPGCRTWQHPYVRCPKCGTVNPSPSVRAYTRRAVPVPERRERRAEEIDEHDRTLILRMTAHADGDGHIPMTACELAGELSGTGEETVGSDVVRRCLRLDGWIYDAACRRWARRSAR